MYRGREAPEIPSMSTPETIVQHLQRAFEVEGEGYTARELSPNERSLCARYWVTPNKSQTEYGNLQRFEIGNAHVMAGVLHKAKEIGWRLAAPFEEHTWGVDLALEVIKDFVAPPLTVAEKEVKVRPADEYGKYLCDKEQARFAADNASESELLELALGKLAPTLWAAYGADLCKAADDRFHVDVTNATHKLYGRNDITAAAYASIAAAMKLPLEQRLQCLHRALEAVARMESGQAP